MQATQLNDCAIEAVSLMVKQQTTPQDRRQLNRLTERINQMMQRSIKFMMIKKNLTNHSEDAFQHGAIAIHKALQTWNPSISSFNTHVHWKLREELSTASDSLFPERRHLARKINAERIGNNIVNGRVRYHEVRFESYDNPKPLKNPEKNGGIEQVHDYNESVDIMLEMEKDVEVAVFREKLDITLASIIIKKGELKPTRKLGAERAYHHYQMVKDYDMFVRYELKGQSMSEIASLYLCTKEWVRQTIKSVRKKIRTSMNMQRRVPKRSTNKYPEQWAQYVQDFYDVTGRDPQMIQAVKNLTANAPRYMGQHPIFDDSKAPSQVTVTEIIDNIPRPRAIMTQRFPKTLTHGNLRQPQYDAASMGELRHAY